MEIPRDWIWSGEFEVWLSTKTGEFPIVSFDEVEPAFTAAAMFLKSLGFRAVSVDNTYDYKGGPR